MIKLKTLKPPPVRLAHQCEECSGLYSTHAPASLTLNLRTTATAYPIAGEYRSEYRFYSPAVRGLCLHCQLRGKFPDWPKLYNNVAAQARRLQPKLRGGDEMTINYTIREMV
mgnify:CR=1 FL=1